MKVYIMTDIEGVGGVVLAGIQTTQGPECDRAREYLTAEVNSAVEGAFKGGADEVLVNDSHSKGFNIRLDLLDPRAELITGAPRPEWMVGLDSSFGAAVVVGFHAMAGTDSAVLDHTMSSVSWQNAWLNGKKCGEFGWMASIAGTFGVPVVFASGDDKLCAEAKALIKGIVTVETKKGISRQAAVCHPLKKVRESIMNGMEEALGRAARIKPLRTASPVELIIEFKDAGEVDSIREIPGRKILDSKRVKYTAKNAASLINLL
jgi:D-amino peptidase